MQEGKQDKPVNDVRYPVKIQPVKLKSPRSKAMGYIDGPTMVDSIDISMTATCSLEARSSAMFFADSGENVCSACLPDDGALELPPAKVHHTGRSGRHISMQYEVLVLRIWVGIYIKINKGRSLLGDF
jgi:hypothetical protein